MRSITRVTAITPTWNEPLYMTQRFKDSIEKVRKLLNRRNIGFEHFFLNDGALYLPSSYPMLVRHRQNQGLATTLIDGYEAVLKHDTKPDLIIRIDAQEHDPFRILEVVEHVTRTQIEALFLPVWYTIEDEPCLPMREVLRLIADFAEHLSPIDEEIVLGTYNQKFPLGYQAFTTPMLSTILPDLKRGLKVFKNITGKRATWGLDLLAILLAAKAKPNAIDFWWGGYAEPWKENRGRDKIDAQIERTKIMLQVAKQLGCV